MNLFYLQKPIIHLPLHPIEEQVAAAYEALAKQGKPLEEQNLKTLFLGFAGDQKIMPKDTTEDITIAQRDYTIITPHAIRARQDDKSITRLLLAKDVLDDYHIIPQTLSLTNRIYTFDKPLITLHTISSLYDD